MKKLLAVLLSVVMVLSLVACGSTNKVETEPVSGEQSESDLEYVKGKGKLIVGITDFEPMDYKDEAGNWIGFDADLAKAFAKEIGVDCEFIEIDWDSKTMELENKNIDLVWNGMTIQDDLKASMNISNAYCNNAQIIVAKKDVIAKLTKAEDAKDLTFAVESGSAGEKAANDNGYNNIAVQTQADAVMEVASGTSDACIIDSLMAAAMVGEGTSYTDLAYASFGLTEEFYGVGGRLNSDLITTLNDFLVKAYADGTVQSIAETYKIQASLIEQK